MEPESGGAVRRRLQKTESAEMRWVVPGGANEDDEIESSDDGGGDTPAAASGSRGGGCSDEDDGYEEDEMLRQRLVRTGPRADSFDVEALDVPGVYRHQVSALPTPRCFVELLAPLGDGEVSVVLARVRLRPCGFPLIASWPRRAIQQCLCVRRLCFHRIACLHNEIVLW
jgi:hypothetical protein